MDIRIYNETDAVSPVIAVILMVAITVILSAIVGTFVLNIGQNMQETAPQATFEAEQGEMWIEGKNGAPEKHTVLNITHVGGEEIEKSELNVKLDGKQAVANANQDKYGPDPYNDGLKPFDAAGGFDDPTVNAGETTHITVSHEGINPNAMDDGGKLHYDWYNGGSNNHFLNVGAGHNTGGHIQSPSGRANFGTFPTQGVTATVIWEGNGNSVVLFEYEIKG